MLSVSPFAKWITTLPNSWRLGGGGWNTPTHFLERRLILSVVKVLCTRYTHSLHPQSWKCKKPVVPASLWLGLIKCIKFLWNFHQQILSTISYIEWDAQNLIFIHIGILLLYWYNHAVRLKYGYYLPKIKYSGKQTSNIYRVYCIIVTPLSRPDFLGPYTLHFTALYRTTSI